MGTQTTPSSKRGQSLPFSACICCGQMARWIKILLCRKVGLIRLKQHCVRRGPSSPSPKRNKAPQFSARFYCAKTAGCIKMPLGIEVGLDTSGIVLDGTQLLSPKRGQSNPFWPTSIMSAWNKMPLCMEVGLSPGHIVLYGDPSPIPPQMGKPLNFLGPLLLWPNGCMRQDAT